MLLKPDVKFHGITDITVEALEKFGIKALLLDVDNTMSTHHGTVLTDGLCEWIAAMQQSGIKLMVLSNSKRRRIEPFANRIGLPFISLGCKPLPTGYLRGVKALGEKRKNTAIVGDQIFTDVLGGNIVGVKTVLLTPIKLEDGWSFKLRRKLEKKVYKRYNIKDYEV
ncbi:MAG: YqeG family HAD IIIA-type phosphatase [Acutalibacteraceae bacterium]|nr:YqeG family HAD IIIA-type phosphatase [Acutalibacteraceae bacterium]